MAALGNRRTFSMSSHLPRLSRAGSMHTIVRGVVDHGTSLLPFSSYPVQLPVRTKKIVPTFFVAAIIIYCALTGFNVATQGYDLVLIPVMQTTFQNSGGTSCQPVQLNVGNPLYTEGSGVYNWVITGVADNEETSNIDSAFAYQGGDMQCNITSIGVTYYFSQITFVYGVCANCSVPTTSAVSWDASTSSDAADLSSGATKDSIVTMCSNYDLSISQPAAWAFAGQHEVQNKIYSFGPFYQNLTFPNATFPIWDWPPYGEPGQPVPTNTAVTPADAQDVSVWMAGIRYTPELIDENGYLGNATINGANHQVEIVGTNQTTDVFTAYNWTVGEYLSGTTLAFNGLGGLAVNGPKTTPEPTVITNMRVQGVSIMNYIMDSALDDVHQRNIVADYLCTHSTHRWKGFWAMLAMVLGNNAALFSLFLFAAPKLARLWDQRENGETVLPFVETHMASAHSRRGSNAGQRSHDPTVVASPRESLELEKGGGLPGNGVPILPHYASYNSTMEPQEIVNHSSSSSQEGGFAGAGRPNAPSRRGTTDSAGGAIHASPMQMRHPTLESHHADETMDITAVNTPASRSGGSSGTPGGRPLPPPAPMRQDGCGMPLPPMRQNSVGGLGGMASPMSAGVTSPSAALLHGSATSPDSASTRHSRGMWGPRPFS